MAAPIWELFEEAVRLGARAPGLLEWDAGIPAFEVVHREALLARAHIERALGEPGVRVVREGVAPRSVGWGCSEAVSCP